MKTWIKWIFYCILTQKERTEFAQAEFKGFDVYDSDASGKVLPGDSIMFYYDRSKPPTRRYLNRREFFEKQKVTPVI